jgi:dihydropyrimidinase
MFETSYSIMVNTLISGGQVVTSSEVVEADVAIQDGVIAAVTTDGDDIDADTEINAEGCYVMPGIVDPHVHIDDMFSIDSYETATRAAARGGVTTLVDFAWQAWEGELSPWNREGTLLEGIDRKQQKAENAYIDYSLHGGITRDDHEVLDELEAAVERGVSSFKMFTAYEIGLPNGFINRVFKRLSDLDAVAALHTEDGDVCDDLTEQLRSEGRSEAEWYPRSRPDYAEAMAAEDAVRMATEAGCKYYGIHTSCRQSAEVLERFQRDYPGLVRFETCTHYTAHDESIYSELGNLPMIAPPIRTEDDVEALFKFLSRGSLDVVSTDHCAFTKESKQQGPWWESNFGANSLQTSLPVFHEVAVNQRGFSYPFLVCVLSANPARLFGLPGKGTMAPGTDADIVVFDPTETAKITADENESKADYSLYEGWEVTGKVDTTLVRGDPVVRDGTIVGDAGHGEFVERERPDWHP